jgi:hypothetical protein
VTHARNVRLIGGSRRKDDRLDAQTLARLTDRGARIFFPQVREQRPFSFQAALLSLGVRVGKPDRTLLEFQ